MSSPKESHELVGRRIYALFQESTPIEVCSHPARAVARAKEWTVPGRPCVVAACKVDYVFGDSPSAPEHESDNGPAADEDHEHACGLGADCPRPGPMEGRVSTVKQLNFDFSEGDFDGEKTWPGCIDCKEGCAFCNPAPGGKTNV